MSIDAVTMDNVKKKYVVMSGKGGVGKSTVAVNLAAALALEGKKVGLLDVDIHGPSTPTMLGLVGEKLLSDGDAIQPVPVPGIDNLAVVSIGFMLQAEDAPVIWRGPMKNGVIKQFLEDVDWGDLDVLIVDCPPGTGDEPLSVIQLLGNADGAVIVTTPQEVSRVDVSKSVNFCRQLNLQVTGIVENMSGFVCPHCGTVTEVFGSGAGKKIADAYGIPLLGSIPVDPVIGEAGDSGIPYVSRFATSQVAEVYQTISRSLV